MEPHVPPMRLLSSAAPRLPYSPVSIWSNQEPSMHIPKNRLLKYWLLATTSLAIIGAPAVANAQILGAVRQFNQATPGDCTTFTANGTISDAGAPCGSGSGGGVHGPGSATSGDVSTFTGSTGNTI